PREVAVVPDVSPTITAAGNRGALLERIDLARVVRVERIRDIEQCTEVVEVGLRCGFLLQVGGTDPFLLKSDNVHARTGLRSVMCDCSCEPIVAGLPGSRRGR